MASPRKRSASDMENPEDIEPAESHKHGKAEAKTGTKEYKKVLEEHFKELRKTERDISKYRDKFNTYKEKYTQIGYDPYAGRYGTYYYPNGTTKKCTSSPLKFIQADSKIASEYPELSSNKDAARIKLLQEMKLDKWLVGYGEEAMIPCKGKPGVPHFAPVMGSDLDHSPSKKAFKEAQDNLVELLNNDEDIATALKSMSDFETFFIEVPGADDSSRYYGTLYYYELGYNNISGLGLLCHICNQHKSAKSIFDWMEEMGLEQEFQKYLEKNKIKLEAPSKIAESGTEALDTRTSSAAQDFLNEKCKERLLAVRSIEQLHLKFKEIEQSMAGLTQTGALSGREAREITTGFTEVAEAAVTGTKEAAKELAQQRISPAALQKHLVETRQAVKFIAKSKSLPAFVAHIKTQAGAVLSDPSIDEKQKEAALTAALKITKDVFDQVLKIAAVVSKEPKVKTGEEDFSTRLAATVKESGVLAQGSAKDPPTLS